MTRQESDLSEPVRLWLEAQGYTPYAEVPMWERHIDWIGVKEGVVIGVEMKTALTGSARYQAYGASLVADFVYVAVATNPRSASIESCRKFGIGILRVQDGRAE